MARRKHRRRVLKERRSARISAPSDVPGAHLPTTLRSDDVQRLTYTRREAAGALGMSIRTLDRRVVPASATVKTEGG